MTAAGTTRIDVVGPIGAAVITLEGQSPFPKGRRVRVIVLEEEAE